MSIKELFKNWFKRDSEAIEEPKYEYVTQPSYIEEYIPRVIVPEGFSVKLINNKFVETN